MHALDALLAREQFGIKLGLDAMRTLCAALGHPERRGTVVHVAGTNGKGSVTAMTARGLAAAGLRTGRYTSPHLIDLAERIAIDDRAIDSEALAHAVSRVLAVETRERDAGRIGAPMTFFELCTAAAFVAFAEAGCDAAVVEVGLGGRFDATNVVTPAITAITNIAMDHMAHLGTTIHAIAFEKAGIIKPGVPVVAGAMPADARTTIAGVALAAGSPLIDARERARLLDEGRDADGRTRVIVQGDRASYGAVTLGLRGAHQVSNAAVAVALLEGLAPTHDIAPHAVRSALSETRWPGRLDMHALPSGTQVLLDAAHNGDGARALAGYLAEIGWNDATCVLGVMRDKDAGEMIDALAPQVSSFIATQASTTRARVADDLAGLVRERCGVAVRVVADVAEALDAGIASGTRVVVCGSIYLLGDVLPLLGRRGAWPA